LGDYSCPKTNQLRDIKRRERVIGLEKDRIILIVLNNMEVLNEDDGTVVRESIVPYSLKYETWYFFSKGIPLMLSAVLEWGVPPLAGMAFAGHTASSSVLQTGLGYARVFYSITTLMIMFSMTNYFGTVLPGAIGAGRHDRVRRYFQRSVVFVTLLWLLFVVPLQIFAGHIMSAVGVPKEIATLVGIYSCWMIPVGWMTMLEVHLELIFINLGYERCALFNSLLTGLCVDIVCAYFFVYKWEWGIKGVALSHMSVKAARILVWIFLAVYYGLGKYFYGLTAKTTITLHSNNSRQSEEDLHHPLLLNYGIDENNEHKQENKQDPFFSKNEMELFWATFAPTLGTSFSTYLIFELQIVALGHIANIPQEAVAAGAIWVQTESTLAAVQRGFLQVTRMRTLKLMGNNDSLGAKKAYTAMCVFCFILVAITNVPLFVFSDDIGVVVSNDVKVQNWLNKIVWVLILHTQTRICSMNGGAIYIAVERGALKVIQNVVGFYVVASPLAAVGALTNIVTTDVATKMIFCVSATAVAQFVIGVWSVLDMGLKQDWDSGCLIVAKRANNDRILAQQGRQKIQYRSPPLLAASPKMASPMLTPSLLPRLQSPLRSVSADV